MVLPDMRNVLNDETIYPFLHWSTPQFPLRPFLRVAVDPTVNYSYFVWQGHTVYAFRYRRRTAFQPEIRLSDKKILPHFFQISGNVSNDWRELSKKWIYMFYLIFNHRCKLIWGYFIEIVPYCLNIIFVCGDIAGTTSIPILGWLSSLSMVIVCSLR